jgi:clathrin heavy chain
VVTDSSTFHWTISDATYQCHKIFNCHASLAGTQIINYRVIQDEKWLVLIGILGNLSNPSVFKVKEAMQLYSKDRGVSQPIERHIAAFAEIKLDSNQHSTKFFTFAV